MSALTSALSCPMHSLPEPESCLHCASYALTTIITDHFLPLEEYVYQEGTSDLATSLYPEIEPSMHTVPRPITAPVAEMTSSPKLRKRSRPNLTISVGPESYHQTIVRREEHDFYAERLALSPCEWPTLFAERHYVDHLALSPDSVSPKSRYRITSQGQGKKTRRSKKKTDTIVISGDEGEKETGKPVRKRRRVIAPSRETTLASQGTSTKPAITPLLVDPLSILPVRSNTSQAESSRKLKGKSGEDANAIFSATGDPTTSQHAQVETTIVRLPQTTRTSNRRVREESVSAASSKGSSDGEEVIHAKTCRCRTCKGK